MKELRFKKEHVRWDRRNVTTWIPYHENGQVYNVFESGFSNMVEMFDAIEKRHPNKELLVDEAGNRLTFREVFESARVLSRALLDPTFSGLKRGDRVGVCSKNSFEWIISYLAAVYAGMIVIPMNSWWTPRELEFGIKHADCKLVFADRERIDRIAQVPKSSLANLKIVLISSSEESSSTTINEHHHPVVISGLTVDTMAGWMREARTKPATMRPETPITPDEPAMIMYTSGTTSFPKGVVLTHRGVGHTCTMNDKVFAEAESKMKGPPRAILLCVPLFHATGLYAVFFNALLAGRKVVIMRKWNAEKALELVEREKVTHFTGVPTMILEMLASPDLKKRDISTLKNIGSGGAPPPAGVAKSVSEKMKASPSQGFGLTEVNAVATMIGAKDYLKKPTSCGRAVPGVEIQIWSEEEDHVEVKRGEVGRIVIRGPNLMLEYWKDAEATSKCITKDGWFKCGDLGHMDEDGFLFISGRSQDLIIRGGENISARTVEEAVFANFETIQECAVFAYPHPTLGEEVGLAIYMKQGEQPPSLEEIRSRCSSSIAQFMLPTGLTVFKTKLPRGATGKTVKKDIKEMLKNNKLDNWTVHSKAKL